MVNATGGLANKSYGMQASGYITMMGGSITANSDPKSAKSTAQAITLAPNIMPNVSSYYAIIASTNGSDSPSYSTSNINTYKYLCFQLNPDYITASKAKTIESSDKSIATVNQKGKITALAKGSCYVYAYAQNGVYKKIKVKVE